MFVYILGVEIMVNHETRIMNETQIDTIILAAYASKQKVTISLKDSNKISGFITLILILTALVLQVHTCGGKIFNLFNQTKSFITIGRKYLKAF